MVEGEEEEEDEDKEVDKEEEEDNDKKEAAETNHIQEVLPLLLCLQRVDRHRGHCNPVLGLLLGDPLLLGKGLVLLPQGPGLVNVLVHGLQVGRHGAVGPPSRQTPSFAPADHLGTMIARHLGVITWRGEGGGRRREEGERGEGGDREGKRGRGGGWRGLDDFSPSTTVYSFQSSLIFGGML